MTMKHGNVDDSEIAKFEKLASRWWDRNSEFKPLHDINPLRAGFIDSKVNLAGKLVLDIGCGGGILAESMARRGARVTGIDMGAAPLAVAKLHLFESKLDIDYMQASAEDWAAQHGGHYGPSGQTRWPRLFFHPEPQTQSLPAGRRCS